MENQVSESIETRCTEGDCINREVKKKDLWDKLASVTTLISSLIIGGAGLWFTNVYETQKILEQSQLNNENQRIAEISIMEKFVPHLRSTDPHSQNVSLLIIRTLGHQELASKLASILPGRGAVDALKTFAVLAEIDGKVDQFATQGLSRVGPIKKANHDKELPGLKALDVAKKELLEKAREVGGNNLGPWVRKYMKGKEGPERPFYFGRCKTRSVVATWPSAIVCVTSSITQSPFALSL